MLSESERSAVVEALLAANRTATQTTGPSTIYDHIEFEDSYAISAEVARRTLAAGTELIGYKVGLTSLAMRRATKIDEPDFGYLFQHFLHPDGATLQHADYCVPCVELELAFVLKDALQRPGVSLLDVMRATEYVVPAIELIDFRVDGQPSIFDVIADNGAAAGVILGGRPVRSHDVDLQMVTGVLSRNAEIEETGVSCGVMAHPANAVAWLANKLHDVGVQLHPGQILLAGSFIRPVSVNPGDTIRADFADLGSISIQFE